MKILQITMLLKNLIKNISKNNRNKIISGLATNSQEIKKNFIFFAIKGNKVNGEKFIGEAIKKGAVVIVCSKTCKIKNKKIIVIKKDNVRLFLAEIASKFYNKKPKNIIAVTGTNGKTSVADLFFQICKINNIPAASIGTLGVKYNNKTIKTNLTSPNTILIHKYLNFLKKKKIENVILEASSHGLDQYRLHHINFKSAIFTNLSQDHLDYHKNMKSYLNSKLILFKEILKKNSLIISDKDIQPFKKLKQIAKKRSLKLYDIKIESKKIKEIILPKLADYKIKNLSMAIKALYSCGLKENLIFKSIKKIKDVSGRLELVRTLPNKSKVFVDYAHTPDALEKTLKSLKNEYSNNITLVFGCGGDRDKKKRPLMSRIAEKNCKKIYVTDDNPRNENPKLIRNEVSKKISKNKLYNIGDRTTAIKKALQTSGPQEIIIIAGKGHEAKQIYKNKIKYILDKNIVRKIKIPKKSLSRKQLNIIQNQSFLRSILNKKHNLKFEGLSIDTRTIKKDNLFLAIKGKNNNGSNFVNTAIKKAAGCIVPFSSIKKHRKNIIQVKNPITFLNKFAELKREHTLAKIISITGSAGKTSLKELLKNLLTTVGSTYASPKSFNNHLGVPLSLSNLSTKNKFGILEVGMSNSGEIRKLSKLIKPHIGVITNIGEAHIENFKSINEIAKAKSEIIENVLSGGTMILNRDDPFYDFLSRKAKSFNLKIISYGKHDSSDIHVKKIIKRDNNSSKIFIVKNNQTTEFEIKDLNIYNVLASIAILDDLKIDFKSLKSKFKNYEPTEGRGKKHFILRYNKKFKLIDESYNANPLSVKNAINKLTSIKKKKSKKLLVLGDMLELGSRSKKYHEELSKVINNSDIDKVLIKGKKTIFTYKHLIKDKRGNILQNIEDIDLSLSKMISNNDYLMIKGSNATGLNDFTKKMIKGI